MGTAVKLFAMAYIALGIFFLLSPDKLKRYISFWRQEKRMKMGAVLCFLFAAFFLLAAPQCRLPWVFAILGALSLIKGVIFLVFGFEKVKAMLGWWDKRSLLAVRLVGLAASAIGALIFYSV